MRITDKPHTDDDVEVLWNDYVELLSSHSKLEAERDALRTRVAELERERDYWKDIATDKND